MNATVAGTCHEHHKLARDFGDERRCPRILCLCDSTHFVEEFNPAAQSTHEVGEIVLWIKVGTTQAHGWDPQHGDPALKARLDELHKREIDLAG